MTWNLEAELHNDRDLTVFVVDCVDDVLPNISYSNSPFDGVAILASDSTSMVVDFLPRLVESLNDVLGGISATSSLSAFAACLALAILPIKFWSCGWDLGAIGGVFVTSDAKLHNMHRRC